MKLPTPNPNIHSRVNRYIIAKNNAYVFDFEFDNGFGIGDRNRYVFGSVYGVKEKS